METIERKQLIVRVEPEVVQRLKVVAAHWDLSMAELVRRTLDDEIGNQRKDERVDAALQAAGL